jgi:hypothetical protein
MISMVFDNAPVYRNSMCNGTEYVFDMCQLPVPDSDSMCSSFATVNCAEGLHSMDFYQYCIRSHSGIIAIHEQ